MFLFLSKLIPMFFYPLGFACVLMLVALLLLVWRQPRLASLPILLGLVVLLAGSNAWVSEWLVQSLEMQNVSRGELPKADAIVVLGGATRPADPPRSGPDLLDEGDRILYGAKLYRDGKAPKLILSGGRVDWLGTGPSESADMAELVKWMGVPESAILQDPTSLNTRENAVNVKQIMEKNNIHTILLVTSALHMPRSLSIFKKLGIDAVAATTDYLTSDRDRDDFQKTAQATVLNTLPDVERLRSTTRAIKEYTGIFIYWLRGWV